MYILCQGKEKKELKISDMDDWEDEEDDAFNSDSDKEKVSNPYSSIFREEETVSAQKKKYSFLEQNSEIIPPPPFPEKYPSLPRGEKGGGV